MQGGEGEGEEGGANVQLNYVVTDPRPQGDPSLQVEEEASPISSRPPALTVPSGLLEDELLERGIGSRIEMVGGGNRWPRQETVALLKIRSEMDTTFRDVNPKGPLWEEVSRKLGELGYKRSAKKCKEKFENVHKYYKRTKEGRAGRQDGKSYKFFTELEALTAATSSSSSMQPHLPQRPPSSIAADIGFSSPAPISSSIRFQPNLMFSVTPPPHPGGQTAFAITPAPDFNPTAAGPPATNIGVSFSSDTNSSFASDSSDNQQKRRRKRTLSSSSSPPRMTSGGGNMRTAEFFKRLMSKVLQKQETMQQRFLEAIEKREHDRMIREEAWKNQEIIRLAKEKDLLAQERAISASRDSAIITFLQKITGQTIQLPVPPIPSSSSRELVLITTPEHQLPPPHEMIINTAEPSSSSSSSRWPKAEILALIELRSRVEHRYQETGPKGALWEEISTGMNRMGFKRNAKRCKEKWENINKYYKKVKESKKEPTVDTKTCPYYHQLDELYRNKILGGGLNILDNSKQQPEEEQQQHHSHEEGSIKKPEDSLKENQQCQDHQEMQFITYDDMELQEREDEDDEMNMGCKIEFQGQNNGASTNSFLTTTVVQ